MTISEKAKKVLSLESEITELRCFMQMLESEKSLYSSSRISDHFVKKTITFSFLGFAYGVKRIEKQIPGKMIAEISDKCKQWIKDLEIQANELIQSDN